MRFRFGYACHASPSARNGLGFTCDGQWATPLTSHMDASALRALILMQGPSGEFAENHQLTYPLLLCLTQGVGYVIHGPVGPVEVQRSSPPASPLVMSPDIESMVHAAGTPSAVMSGHGRHPCHECSAVRAYGDPSLGQDAHGFMVASRLRLG